MALPTIKRSRGSSRDSARIHHMAEKRMQDEEKYQRWQANCNYFKTSDVKSYKEQFWTSDSCYQESMLSYNEKLRKDRRTQQLLERRQKLRELLSTETIQYENELMSMSPDKRKLMKDRADELRLAREDRRKEIVQEKLAQKWRQDCPKLREVESRCKEREVISSWSKQIQHKQQKEDEEKAERERYDADIEKRRQMLLKKEQEELEKKKREELEIQLSLQKQMEEIKARESEAVQLENEQAEVLKEQLALEQANKERKALEMNQQKQELGRRLLHQQKAQLRRKCQEIQKSLELDLKILEEIGERERKELMERNEKRHRERLESEKMREIFREQLQLEKQREAELDFIYKEEAARQWSKREAEWEREKKAREMLMAEVLAQRQEQLEERLVDLRDKRLESIERREELLKELEIANQLTVRENEKKRKEKEIVNKELKSQISAKQRLDLEAKLEREKEANKQKLLEEEYDERVKKETVLLTSRYQNPPQYYSKRYWYY